MLYVAQCGYLHPLLASGLNTKSCNSVRLHPLLVSSLTSECCQAVCLQGHATHSSSMTHCILERKIDIWPPVEVMLQLACVQRRSQIALP